MTQSLQQYQGYSLGWLHLISTCNKLPPRSDQSTKADIGNNYALATLIIIFSFYKLLFQAYILIILRVCVCPNYNNCGLVMSKEHGKFYHLLTQLF